MKIKQLLVALLCFQMIFSQSDTANQIKIKKSLEKAQDYYNVSKDSLIYHANYVIQHSHNENEKGLALHYLGNTYTIAGDLDKAFQCFQKENSIFKRVLEAENNTNFKNNYANSFASMAIIMSQKSNYTEALKYHFKAKTIFTETNNSTKLAALYNNIGIEYQSLGKLDLANYYFIEATKLNTKLQISNALLYTNIGKNYLKKANYKQAKNYLDKALQAINKEENPRTKGELYNNWASYYLNVKDYSKSKYYLDQALVEFEKIEDVFGLSDSYYFLGLYYLSQNNETEALVQFDKAMNIALSLNSIELQYNIQKKKVEIYQKQKNFEKAFEHQAKVTVLQKVLLQDNNDKAIAFAEMNSDFEKNKAELIRIKEEQKRNLYLYILAVVVLVMSIIFAFYYSRQKLIKKNLALEKEKAELHHKALHLQMNPHFIFNCLGSISSFILQNENEIAINYLNHFARLMRLTLENFKEKEIYVDKEIESLKQYFELEKMRYEDLFDYTIIKTENITEDMKIPPMLIQPLVENAIIHGIVPKKQKGKIQVVFDLQNNRLTCTIQDDGVGYFYSKKLKEGSVLSHKSIALEVVRNRIETMGGSFNIEENNGTNIILSF